MSALRTNHRSGHGWSALSPVHRRPRMEYSLTCATRNAPCGRLSADLAPNLSPCHHRDCMAEQTIEAIKAWERQPEEGPEAFEAFQAYRDMPLPRSIRNCAVNLGKSDTLIGRWSSAHQWQHRILAYDRHICRASNQRIQLGSAEMRTRLITQSMNIQAQVARRVVGMTEQEIAKMKPTECVAMLRLAAEIEMKARAVPSNELEETEERMFAPTFVIEFVPTTPEKFVTVRLTDGSSGYIPEGNVEAFVAEFPDAVVLMTAPVHELENLS